MRPSLVRLALPLALLHAGCAPTAPRPHAVAAPAPLLREAALTVPDTPAPALSSFASPSPLPVLTGDPSPEPTPPPAVSLPTVPRERTRVTVLAYHFFDGPDTPLTIPTAAFERQMRWLAEQPVARITAADLTRFLDGALPLPERAAVVIIDDGAATAYTKAFPVLKKYGIRFTLAINTAVIEQHRHDALTWEQAREMVASGLCDLASHGHTHARMDQLSDAQSRLEAARSRAIIEDRTGVRPEAFVFPFGGHSAHVRRVIEETGYRAAFGVGGQAVEHDSPRFQLPRVGVMKDTTMAMFAALFSDRAWRGKRAL